MIDIDLGGNWADELLESMQAPNQREAMNRAFHATPKELGAAPPVKQAKTVDSGTHYDDMDMGHRQTHNK